MGVESRLKTLLWGGSAEACVAFSLPRSCDLASLNWVIFDGAFGDSLGTILLYGICREPLADVKSS
jgi:hypothetical protein